MTEDLPASPPGVDTKGMRPHQRTYLQGIFAALDPERKGVITQENLGKFNAMNEEQRAALYQQMAKGKDAVRLEDFMAYWEGAAGATSWDEVLAATKQLLPQQGSSPLHSPKMKAAADDVNVDDLAEEMIPVWSAKAGDMYTEMTKWVMADRGVTKTQMEEWVKQNAERAKHFIPSLETKKNDGLNDYLGASLNGWLCKVELGTDDFEVNLEEFTRAYCIGMAKSLGADADLNSFALC